jgi:hypothetical protein
LPQHLGKGVTVKTMGRIVRQVHCPHNAVAIRIVIGNSPLVPQIADSTVIAFAAIRMRGINLIPQRQQTFCYTPCHIWHLFFWSEKPGVGHEFRMALRRTHECRQVVPGDALIGQNNNLNQWRRCDRVCAACQRGGILDLEIV